MSPWHPVFEGGRFAKGCVATEASAYAAVRLGPSGGGSLCAVSAEAGDAEKVVTSAMEQAIATMHFFMSILTDGEEGLRWSVETNHIVKMPSGASHESMKWVKRQNVCTG